MKKYRDFETRKGVHISLTRDTHAELKINLIRRGLSFQETFESIAVKIIEGDKHLDKLLNKILDDKIKGNIKGLVKTDAESVFRVIENSNPFSGRGSEDDDEE